MSLGRLEVSVSLLAFAMFAVAGYLKPQKTGRITMAAKKSKTDKTKDAPT